MATPLLALLLCLLWPAEAVRGGMAVVAHFAHSFFTSRMMFRMVAFVCDESEGLQLLRGVSARGGLQLQVVVQVQLPVRPAQLLGSRPTGALLLTHCPPALELLREVSAQRLLFNSSVLWLLVGERPIPLDALPLRLDSELTLAEPLPYLANASQFALSEVYRLDPLPDLVTKPVGMWHPTAGFGPPLETCLTTRRGDISGVGIRAALYLDRWHSQEELDGLRYLDKDKSVKEMTNLAKFSHLVQLNAAEMFNISVVVTQSDDPGQLEPQPNQTLAGLLRLAELDQAEVLASGMVVTRGRWRVLAYGAIIWKLRANFIFLAPSALGDTDALTRPFSPPVWLSLLAVSGAVLLLTRVNVLEDREERSWGACFSRVLGILTSQGLYVRAGSLPGRVLLLTFELLCLVAYGFYSAAVVTFLLRPPHSSIRTPRDMLAAHFRAAAHHWLHTIRTVSNSSDPLMREVWERMMRPPQGPGAQSTLAGGLLLRQPRTAFYGSDESMYQSVEEARLTQAEICRLREVLFLEPDLYVSLGMRKTASIVAHFRLALVRQLERGALSRELRVWRGRRPGCLLGAGHVTGQVGVRPLVPALAVLLGGLLAATNMLVLEVLRWRRKMSHRAPEGVLSM